jgi:hypothetical protein
VDSLIPCRFIAQVPVAQVVDDRLIGVRQPDWFTARWSNPLRLPARRDTIAAPGEP